MRVMSLPEFLTIYIVDLVEEATWFFNIMLSEIGAVVYQGCRFEFCLGKNKNLLVKKYLFVVKYWWLKWNMMLADSISKVPYCSSLLILMICIYMYRESQMKYILCIFVYSIVFLFIFFYMDNFYRPPPPFFPLLVRFILYIYMYIKKFLFSVHCTYSSLTLKKNS